MRALLDTHAFLWWITDDERLSGKAREIMSNGRNAFQVLPIHLSYALHVYELPDHHRDPFDRLLVSQATVEKKPLFYPVEVVW